MRKNYFVLLLIVALFPFAAQAQTDVENQGVTLEQEAEQPSRVSVDYSIKFKTQHLWNGLVSYDSWCFTPDLYFEAYGFYLDAWACIPFPASSGEIDLSIGYSHKYFDICHTDVYYHAATENKRVVPHLTRWHNNDLGNVHQGWTSILFKGVKYFPISIQVAMFTYGDSRLEPVEAGEEPTYTDKDNKVPLLNDEGLACKRVDQYSMYIGLGYSLELKGGQTLDFEVGGTPYKGWFYPEGPNIVNISFTFTQPFHINDRYTIPLSAQFVVNPAYEQFYFVAAIGLFTR